MANKHIVTGSKTVGTALGLSSLLLAAATVVFWFRAARLVAIPENRALFVALWVLAIVLGVAAFVMRTRWFGGVAALLGIALGLFLPFTIAISRQEVAPNGIKAGETIPQFTALTDEGESFDSASLSGQLVLLKFFRAHW